MNFALNEEQSLFQESTRQYLESKGDLEIPRKYMEGKDGVMDDLWKGLGELGYMGINISEEYGGIGLGALSLVPILEEMGRSCVPGPYPETVAFAVPLIEKYGSEAIKKQYLPDIAAGNKKITLALFEGNDDLSPKAIQMRAAANGDEYVLSGRKIIVPHADASDAWIVPVRTAGTSGEYGITLLLVDREGSNVQMNQQQAMDETKKVFTLSFEEVRISKEKVIGLENAGWPILQYGIFSLNAALSSTMTGGIDRTVSMAAEYARTREQFGQPIGRFQAVKHKIVEMKLALENARSLSYYAAWAVENDSDDMAEAVAMAKSYISEAFIKTSGANIQIHGGMGFTWEYNCHLFLKRARFLENYLGSPAEHRETVARELGW